MARPPGGSSPLPTAGMMLSLWPRPRRRPRALAYEQEQRPSPASTPPHHIIGVTETETETEMARARHAPRRNCVGSRVDRRLAQQRSTCYPVCLTELGSISDRLGRRADWGRRPLAVSEEGTKDVTAYQTCLAICSSPAQPVHAVVQPVHASDKFPSMSLSYAPVLCRHILNVHCRRAAPGYCRRGSRWRGVKGKGGRACLSAGRVE